MELEQVVCHSCGAPLQVPTTARFVTCDHCSTHLAVRREGGARFTEQMDQLLEETQELHKKVDRLVARSEDAPDPMTDEQLRQFLSRGPGRMISAAPVVGGLGMAAFGTFWTIMAMGITSHAPSHGPFTLVRFVFPLFGLVFVGMGLASAWSGWKRSQSIRDRLDDEDQDSNDFPPPYDSTTF